MRTRATVPVAQGLSLYCLAASLTLLSEAAPAAGRKTYCNPVDIDYQYNFEQKARNISYRSGADPVIVNHQGQYYLFSTISGGWWHSRDLSDWRYVKPSVWPAEDNCAPAALSVGDRLYIFQSTYDRRPIYSTATPWDGRLEVVNSLPPYMPGAPGPWDPAVFRDPDTGRWFMYFGSSNLYPLYGVELDPENQLNYLGTAREMIALRPDVHGWERFGPDHRYTVKPFIEGAWMTKHAGKYYLQYGAPGTEYNVYANGTYIGEGPMGPFSYAPNNPIAYKPGGFVTGAGHGNTFQDNFGNYWNTGTPWVGLNFDFERRIAMFPAAFDKDGLLFANTSFGDFPHYLPDSSWENKDALFTGWMLLSYKKPCRSSSAQPPFEVTNLTDENPRTFWLAEASRAGEWVELDLGGVCQVRAVQVNYADYQSGIYATDTNVFTRFKLLHSADGKEWHVFADLSGETRDRPNAYLQAKSPVNARYIKYEHIRVAAPNLAISDIRVFGLGGRHPPSPPGNIRARRDSDPRNAFLNWDPVPGATGYNVLWGIQDDKLYQTYQVFADRRTELELRALTAGQSYSFAVEAFNDSGVSRPSAIARVR